MQFGDYLCSVEVWKIDSAFDEQVAICDLNWPGRMQSRAVGLQSSHRSLSLKKKTVWEKGKVSSHNLTRIVRNNQSSNRLNLRVSSDGAVRLIIFADVPDMPQVFKPEALNKPSFFFSRLQGTARPAVRLSREITSQYSGFILCYPHPNVKIIWLPFWRPG